MLRNLKSLAATSIKSGLLKWSTVQRCYLPITSTGHQKQVSSPYSSQEKQNDNDNNSTNSFKKYGIALIVAFGAVFAAYQFNFLPKFESDGESPESSKKKKFKRPSKVFKYPSDSTLIPDKVPYLLIGGGTASFSAFRAIKSADPKAKVLVVGNEPFNPYMRPPLSKEMFYNEDRDLAKNLKFKQWNASERSLFYEPEDFYTQIEDLIKPSTVEGSSNEVDEASNNYGGISVVRGWHVTNLDPTNKLVTLEDGKTIQFDKCLLATGASPKNLDVFKNHPELKEKVTVYRNVFDFQELESVIEHGAKSIAIVGSGFLGSELACALAKRGGVSNTSIYQIYRDKGNMSRVLPEYLSSWTTKKVESEGVTIIKETQIEKATLSKDEQIDLQLSNGDKLKVDHVVVAVGVEPNTELAKNAGLEIDSTNGGFVVNSELSARSDIYAAGDCACFYDIKLGRRRVEHHDHAVVSGRLAGENMAGAHKHYWHQSMFWSDLGPDVGFEAIGIVDSRLPTVGVYAKSNTEDTPKAAVTASGTSDRSSASKEESSPPIQSSTLKSADKSSNDYGKGVIFYLKNDIVVGIVLWNVFNKMSVARQVLKSDRKYDDLNEVAKLFNIHTE